MMDEEMASEIRYDCQTTNLQPPVREHLSVFPVGEHFFGTYLAPLALSKRDSTLHCGDAPGKVNLQWSGLLVVAAPMPPRQPPTTWVKGSGAV